MSVQAPRDSGCTAPTHWQPGSRRRLVISITLRPLYPKERTSTHCRGGWVGLGAGLGGTDNLTSPGFDAWTVQPIASRQTDWTIPAARDIWILIVNSVGDDKIQKWSRRMVPVSFPSLTQHKPKLCSWGRPFIATTCYMSAGISTSWALNLGKKQMTDLCTSRLQVRKHYTASRWHWTVSAVHWSMPRLLHSIIVCKWWLYTVWSSFGLGSRMQEGHDF